MIVGFWFVMALVSIPWAMIQARKRGYSPALWCVLALIFGLFAVLVIYILPKKDRDERVGDALARGVTTGAVSAGKVARDTIHEQAPDMAAHAGRGVTDAVINVGTGPRKH